MNMFTTKKAIIALAMLGVLPVAMADDSGYSRVTEIKSWPSTNNIYLEASHVCGGSQIGLPHIFSQAIR